MTTTSPPRPYRSRSAARAATSCTIGSIGLLVLAACGGGGGGGGGTPSPSAALTWGSGAWGQKQWSAGTAPAHIAPDASSSSSQIDLNSLTLETSR